jgi:hypothetical protein
MKNNNLLIVIQGKASDDLIKKWCSSFKKTLEKNNLLLFCDYSEYEIPKGHNFVSLQRNGVDIFSGTITLKGVTQEFFKPFDCIPKGWKTISEFEFHNEISEVLKMSIPEIADWFSPNGVRYQMQ